MPVQRLQGVEAFGAAPDACECPIDGVCRSVFVVVLAALAP